MSAFVSAYRPATFLFLLLSLLLTACSPRQMLLRGVADELAQQGQSVEDDVELAREASAFYLKLSESVLRADPAHPALAESVAAGFAQYAYAFVACEADRIEARDGKAAQQLRSRAARLYQRARQHALTALELRHPGLLRALAEADPARRPRLANDEVGLAYWAAAAWGGWISLSTDSAETLADLPLAHRLAESAWQIDPGYGQGALASLLGRFEASRPGGQRSAAAVFFDRGIELGAGQSAAPFLAKAEGLAQPAGDRLQFIALLRQTLAVREPASSPLALSNEIMRRRAQWLLDHIDTLF